MTGKLDTPRTGPAKAPRDLRLDFFRGLAMFIILLAHTPGNTWTLWIPARFGFSDATEIFVFCSGMASALAFGAVFSNKSWWLGSARIVFRVWQVYWAHIGVFLITALLMVGIDRTGLGPEGKIYADWPSVVMFFRETHETLFGLFTLTYVAGLFDILPMYLAILAMIPVIMLAHKLGGRWAVFLLMGVTWAAAQTAGFARGADDIANPTDFQAMVIATGEYFQWMNLPGSPFNENRTWFFNPFAWQLVFFTGFAFGMGWIPAPPVKTWLVILAAVIVIGILPFAWHQIHGGRYLPGDWQVTMWIKEVRSYIQPLRSKTFQGFGRYAHFLALAYLAWVAVGPKGIRLSEGFRTPGVAPKWGVIAAGVVAVATLPYALVYELHTYARGLHDLFIDINWLGLVSVDEATGESFLANPERIGLLQLMFLAAAIVLAWAAVPQSWRTWTTTTMVVRTVPVIRKVGTQSLAVFMVSIVLSRFSGFVLDVIDRDVWTRGLVNIAGFGVLITVAYGVSWFKRQPWRSRPGEPTPSAGVTNEMQGAADPRGRPPIAAMRS